jgi:hypothetical protein
MVEIKVIDAFLPTKQFQAANAMQNLIVVNFKPSTLPSISQEKSQM